MTAPTLRIVCDAVYLACLAAWVGGLGFALGIVGPLLSRALPAESAREVSRALWAHALRAGSIAGALALPAFLCVPLCFPEYRGLSSGIQAAAIVGATFAMLHGANRLAPRRGRPPSPEGGLTTILPAIVIAVGLGLLLAFAERPPARTSGLIDWPVAAPRPGVEAPSP